MDLATAIQLLEGALPGSGVIWADLGCGDGTFTLALANRLGSGARIYAIDHDPAALMRLRRSARSRTITASIHLSVPVVTATFPSAFTGTLYAAYSVRRDPRDIATIT